LSCRADLQRKYWDELYRRGDYVYGTEPSSFLRKQAFRLKPGMEALLPGDGEGRNGVWLARQGLNVVSADLSRNAHRKAVRLARRHDVRLTFECCNILEREWEPGQFDLVAAIYLHLPHLERQMLHSRMADWLKEGGWLLLEAFHFRQAERSGQREEAGLLYSEEILRQDFHFLEIDELAVDVVTLKEGTMHQGAADVLRLVAHKPSAPSDVFRPAEDRPAGQPG
jgi:cyclopropane fatty-acyl-phospholipid synthase-like methyltransferase